jgi:hypothetical protein
MSNYCKVVFCVGIFLLVFAGKIFAEDGEDVTGRLSIRDSSDFLVAELTKPGTKPIELGLEPGLYRITLQKGDNFYRMDSVAEDVPVNVLNFQLIPGMDITGHGGEKATNNFLLGPVMAMGHNLQGIGLAGIGLINSGWVQGLQGSGIFNYAEGDFLGIQGAGILNYSSGNFQGIQGSVAFNYAEGNSQGVQGSGIFNYAGGNSRGVQGSGVFNYAGGSFQGVQASGLFNYTEGGFKGIQAGLVNMAGDGGSGAAGAVTGVQVGIVNISKSENMVTVGFVNVVKNGLMHPSIFYDDMGFVNAGFRSGSKRGYSLITLGIQGETLLGRTGEDTLLSSRMGLGREFQMGKIFMDVDLSFGNILNIDALKDAWNSGGNKNQIDSASLSMAQLRFTAGYKIFEHLGVFAGISYDYMYRHNDNSPDPETFAPFMMGASFGRHIHKLGFFGGVQF